MKNTFLMVETSSLESRSGAAATANLWLVLDGYAFPTQCWNDFVVVVLNWWVTALLRLFRGTSTKEVVNFMDGPYMVEVSVPSSGTFQFRAFEGANRTREMASGCAAALEFAASLITQGREVLEACKGQDWWSSDAAALEASLNLLQQDCERSN